MANSVWYSIKIVQCLLLNSLVCMEFANGMDSDGIFVDSYDVKKPTVRTAINLNITAVTKQLRHAMEGYGTNEKEIVRIVTPMDFYQRKLIEAEYSQLFKRNLKKDFESELSGSFKKLMFALLETPTKILSDHLYIAMQGWGTDEDSLTEIICCHNSDDIGRIANEYKRKYKKDLDDAVKSETSGKYRNLLHILLTSPRKSDVSKDNVNETGNEIAQNFVRAGFGKSGKLGEPILIHDLTASSYPQLHSGIINFKKIVGHNLEDAVKRVYSGDYGRALLRIIECTENRPRAYAKRLHDAFGTFRNDDNALIRIIALRSSIDLEAIKSEYQKLFNETLEHKIINATSGDLRSGLLALITGRSPK